MTNTKKAVVTVKTEQAREEAREQRTLTFWDLWQDTYDDLPTWSEQDLIDEVRGDLLEDLKENIEMLKQEPPEEIKAIYTDEQQNDGITGLVSGSYSYSTYKSYELLARRPDLISQAIEYYGYNGIRLYYKNQNNDGLLPIELAECVTRHYILCNIVSLFDFKNVDEVIKLLSF